MANQFDEPERSAWPTQRLDLFRWKQGLAVSLILAAGVAGLLIARAFSSAEPNSGGQALFIGYLVINGGLALLAIALPSWRAPLVWLAVGFTVILLMVTLLSLGLFLLPSLLLWIVAAIQLRRPSRMLIGALSVGVGTMGWAAVIVPSIL